MIYLDTHVVIWLAEGSLHKFPTRAKDLLNQESLKISPMVRLELQFLYDIKRIGLKPDEILAPLYQQLNLLTCQEGFPPIIHHAMDLSWTRDLFDRVIVATASLFDTPLLTKDQHIRTHYAKACWD